MYLHQSVDELDKQHCRTYRSTMNVSSQIISRFFNSSERVWIHRSNLYRLTNLNLNRKFERKPIDGVNIFKELIWWKIQKNRTSKMKFFCSINIHRKKCLGYLVFFSSIY